MLHLVAENLKSRRQLEHEPSLRMTFQYALASLHGVLLKSDATYAPVAKIVATLSVMDSLRSPLPWCIRCSSQYYVVAPLTDLPFYIVLASIDFISDAALVSYFRYQDCSEYLNSWRSFLPR